MAACQQTFSYNVLLIGDSIDRFIVEDWCYIDRPKPPSKRLCPDCFYWFDDTGSKWDSSMCTKGNDSIANVHHFGSRDTGPYFSKENVNPRDFAPNIIKNSISHYFVRVGVPDLVLYQAVMWDAAYIKDIHTKISPSSLENVTTRYTASWNQTIATYKENMIKRIRDVQTAVRESIARLNRTAQVNIGLRTAVYNKNVGSLGGDFNNVVRQLSREFNITLFDLDRDVWSTYNFNYSSKEHLVLRDVIHPLPYFTSMAGMKLLGHRYTSNMIFRGPMNTRFPRPRICLTSSHVSHQYHCSQSILLNEPIAEVMLVAADENQNYSVNGRSHFIRRALDNVSPSTQVFYLHREAFNRIPERVGPITDHLRQVLRLSQGDILFLPNEQVQKLPLSHLRFPPISSGENARSLILNTTEGHLYMYFPDKEIFRLYSSTIDGLKYFGFQVTPGKTASDASTCLEIIQNISEKWLTSLFSLGPAIPNIFRERALIRFVESKEVFVVLNGEKRSIPNMGVFFQYGSDFSEVQVVVDRGDFNLIPTGPSL